MAHEEIGITAIAGQLASRMPTKGVAENDVKEAIRNTLHYAEDVGLMGELTRRIEEEADGDTEVSHLCETLRQR